MFKKLFTRLLFGFYNIYSLGKLNFFYNSVKNNNEFGNFIEETQLKSFLIRWGFKIPLEDNPIMQKSDILNWVNKVDIKKVHWWAYTGGSYGEPLKLPYSKKRSLIKTATFLYYNELGGYQLGDSFVIIRAKNRSKIMKMFRNEMIFIPYDLSDTSIVKFVELLINKKVNVIIGYPSVIYELAVFLNNYPNYLNRLNIKSIISVSEPLEEDKRKFINMIFPQKFVDRYSNEEVGLIAQQITFDQPYIINKYGLIVEILHPETLLPVEEGEKGKVIVTDLCNDLVPIVRYDTGDIATADKYANGRLISIRNILGRVTEKIFSTSGIPISPLVIGPYIYKPLSNNKKPCQYQFAQVGQTEYELRLKLDFVSESLINEIKNGLVSILGPNANIDIKPVSDITPQPSGKRPVFKNEVKEKKL